MANNAGADVPARQRAAASTDDSEVVGTPDRPEARASRHGILIASAVAVDTARTPTRGAGTSSAFGIAAPGARDRCGFPAEAALKGTVSRTCVLVGGASQTDRIEVGCTRPTED
eukprot:TRINITY_DN34094_c0_g1_i1.p10 TRINITY_DN34094_c0_g1~~TRINITY_DN34094_c0_g1_i1.p10  ORF type:complete len:114 (-),score=4.04 TRINITY_DN34094_c0_g1_i1:1231-1572(-)